MAQKEKTHEFTIAVVGGGGRASHSFIISLRRKV